MTPTERGAKFGWQRFDDAVKAWADEAPWIEVGLIQGGELLERLAKDEHRGRRWFWFGQPEPSTSTGAAGSAAWRSRKLERGKSNPTWATVKAIAAALDLSMGKLATLIDRKTPRR